LGGKAMMRIAALLLLLAASALAQTPMTAEEFAALVTGNILTYAQNGEPYGIEYYGENRRVIWSFLDGKCQNGRWYQDGANICFIYDFDPDPQCWRFYDDPQGLRAVFATDPSNTALYQVENGDLDLICDNLGV
jgi:hypothetical protein